MSVSFPVSRETIRRTMKQMNMQVRRHQRARFLPALQGTAAAELSAFTQKHYANTSDEGDIDLALAARLHNDRYTVIPWLDAALPLAGARILEIGCGTGESTLALTEQGAQVTGIDVDEGALAVGRERLRMHGLSGEFHVANAADLASLLRGRSFDIVVFFASLEHMTLSERLAALAQSWSLLRPGGVLCVYEAPNRLWYWDGHTSMENFYHWLPNDLASRWAHRSRREAFAEVFPADPDFAHESEANSELVARWGRGVSFHEFDLVFGDVRDLDVVSGKQDFLLAGNPLLKAKHAVSRARTFERFLEAIAPNVHPAFLRQYLDVIIRKPA